MYLPTTSSLGLSTNGFQRMHIKSNGDVGFGAIPFNDYNFQVSTNSGSGNEVIFVVNNNGTTPNSATTARFDFGVFSDASNYVASNTVLGQTNFIGQANDARYVAAKIDAIVTNAGNVGRGAGHSGIMRFYTKPTNSNGVSERMKINEVGEVTINNLAGINDVGADANGKLQAATSDMNLKNTIENSPFGLNEILLLNPVTFLYNDTNRKIDSDVKEVGFIAQDVFDIIPNAVSSTGTGDLQLDYRAITATLTKAIQEQQALIKALEQRIINLENK
ncbi:MAG: tail fiber domain-containing protein [Caulobacteraceae bacterium]|nr:tail fiber domain-containing protein [Caulobacteraceae bacterium]